MVRWRSEDIRRTGIRASARSSQKCLAAEQITQLSSLRQILDIVIVALFIAALAVTRGQQKGILQGAEVALIVVILLTGALVNHIRVRRKGALMSLDATDRGAF